MRFWIPTCYRIQLKLFVLFEFRQRILLAQHPTIMEIKTQPKNQKFAQLVCSHKKTDVKKSTFFRMLSRIDYILNHELKLKL